MLQRFNESATVASLLPNRFVKENYAADKFACTFGSEQDFPISAAVFFGRLHADRVEALLDGAGGFVGGKDALAGRDQGGRDPVQLSQIHRDVLPKRFCPCR